MRITVAEAITLLQEGKVIGIPTDTVYGLAASMHHPEAVKQIFEIKKRPNDKPLIILASDLSQIVSFIKKMPHGFNELTEHFWPGALTLVVPIKTSSIDNVIRAGLDTTGFRIPAHPMTLEVIKHCGPIVAPSANFSGKASPINAGEVENYFGKDFPVMDGGPTQHGVESTILVFENEQWKVSRQGAITKEQLEDVLGYIPESRK